MQEETAPSPPCTPKSKSNTNNKQQDTELSPQSERFKSPGTKSRRKLAVEKHALTSSTAVQRLVEYFVVVSSEPRWKKGSPLQTPDLAAKRNNKKKPNNDPQSEEEKKEQDDDSRPKATTTNNAFQTPPQRSSTNLDPNTLVSPQPLEGTERKRNNPKLASILRFRKRDDSKSTFKSCLSADGGASSSSGSTSDKPDEPPEEAVTIPSPRSEWTREQAGSLDTEEEEGEETEMEEEEENENIHMPSGIGCDHAFQPKITARFPLTDHADNPLNPMISQFCYPAGDVIVPSTVYELPRVHHFVLTNDKGRKVYGTCLTFYEEYHPTAEETWRTRDEIHSENSESDIEVTMSNGGGTALYIPRVLCLLSTWPYLTAFREYLAQLYRLASTTNVMQCPIERYVLNLCMEIPAPPPGAYEVQVSILNSTIRFWAPPAKLPIAYVALPYQTLFDCLDVENILLLWNAMIMENKVLLVSSQYSLLTICAEILTSLLFPMRWCHLYVPVLPRFICPMLDAPVPYLCGVVRENWLYAQQYVSQETIVVDLDRNKVAFGQLTPELVPAPARKWGKLQTAIEQTAGHLFWRTRGVEEEHRALKQQQGRKLNMTMKRNLASLQKKGGQRWKEKLHSFDHAFNLAYTPTSENLLNDACAESEQSQWDRVQEAFLRFFVALLKDYRRFLKEPVNNAPGSFDKEAFIAAQKPENIPFLMELCETQQFEDYISKRLYSPGEPDVIFFDQSIDAKLNRSRLKLRKVDTPFLQSAKAHKVLKKVQAVEPSMEGLPEGDMQGPFVYKMWPATFREELFGAPKPIPEMIAAEFDRQAVLVSRLRHASYLRHEESENGEIVTHPGDNLDFFPSDYDPSPEVASCTVFFFTYSTLIGRDWKEFQKQRRELELENSTILVSDEQAVTPQQTEVAVESVVVQNMNVTSERCAENCCAGVAASSFPYLTPYKYAPNFSGMSMFSGIKEAPVQPVAVGFVTPNRCDSLMDCVEDNPVEYEEARAVAVAQLDLGFQTLSTMTKLRNLPPDADAYKSLMEACGRCGDTQRALELIELMKRDGLVDGEVLSWFLHAFAHNEEDAIDSRPSPANRESVLMEHRHSDAYYRFLQKKLAYMEQAEEIRQTASGLAGLLSSDDEASSVFSDESHTSSNPDTSANQSASFMDWFNGATPAKKPNKPKKKKKMKRRKRKSSFSIGMPVTDAVAKQIVLAENLLDFLYPSLAIDTNSDCCPQCSNQMKDDDIIQGWNPCAFQDYTTACPKCHHRFVPRFSVTNLAPDFQGSQGLGTPLYCEYLSPWVLRKELDAVAQGRGGIEEMVKPEWRSGIDIHSTLWWNVIVLCRKYRLPFSYLLQGSFQNRLISPTP